MDKKSLEKLINLFISFVSIIVIFIIIEFGIRIFYGGRIDFDQVYKRYHPLIKYVHPPNLNVRILLNEHPKGYFDLRTNNQGLREDADSVYENSGEKLRILVLGDSHTDGTVFNQETYPNQVERILAYDGTAVEVLNAGVAGYSTLDELLWFIYFGRKYTPDIVLLGVYVGNDLVELSGFDLVRISSDWDVFIDGELHQPVAQSAKEKLQEWSDHSYLITMAKFGFRAFVRPEFKGEDAKAHRICRGCYWQSLNQIYRFRKSGITLDNALSRFENVLIELERSVQITGSKFVVLFIPTKRQVEGEESDAQRYELAAETLMIPEDERDFNDIVLQRMQKVCDENDIKYINLLPEMHETFMETGMPYYYYADWHLNPEGHLVLAELITARLLEK
jgi:lysophospholipase L1-like esterase